MEPRDYVRENWEKDNFITKRCCWTCEHRYCKAFEEAIKIWNKEGHPVPHQFLAVPNWYCDNYFELRSELRA